MPETRDGHAVVRIAAALAVAASATGVGMLVLAPLFWLFFEWLVLKLQPTRRGFHLREAEYERATHALARERAADAALTLTFDQAESKGLGVRSDGMWKGEGASEFNARRDKYDAEIREARQSYQFATSAPTGRFADWRIATGAAMGARAVLLAWFLAALAFQDATRGLARDIGALFSSGFSNFFAVAGDALIPVSFGMLIFAVVFVLWARSTREYRPKSGPSLLHEYERRFAGTRRERMVRKFRETILETVAVEVEIDDKARLEIVSEATVMRFVVSADGAFSSAEREAIHEGELALVGDDEGARDFFREVFEKTVVSPPLLDAALGLHSLLLEGPEQIEASPLFATVLRLAESDEVTTEEAFRIEHVRSVMNAAWERARVPELEAEEDHVVALPWDRFVGPVLGAASLIGLVWVVFA